MTFSDAFFLGPLRVNHEPLGLCFTNWDPKFTDTRVTEKCTVMDVKTGTWFINNCLDDKSVVCEMFVSLSTSY